jgi:hypothetical protein
MANAKSKVAVAVAATVKTQVTPGTFLSLDGEKLGKTKLAPAMTAEQQAAYDLGFDIGTQDAENEQGVIDALATCTGKLRVMLRHGYVAGYTSAMRYVRGHYVWPTEKQAKNRFDNTLAKKHAPAESSRQAKHNAKRKPGGGRKVKVAFTAKKDAESDTGNVAVALAYIKSAQKTHADDADILQVLGDLAKILRKKA